MVTVATTRASLPGGLRCAYMPPRKLFANADSASASSLAVSGGGIGILKFCAPLFGSRSIQGCAGAPGSLAAASAPTNCAPTWARLCHRSGTAAGAGARFPSGGAIAVSPRPRLHPLARYPPRRLDVPHNVVPPRALDIALLEVVRYVVDWRAGLARLGAAAMTSPGTPGVIGDAGRQPNVLIHAVKHSIAT
jgi:hypothetical protein